MACAYPCGLFGAYQALGGIRDNVVLFHSVVGCHFGVLGFHLCRDMADLRQASTVISEKDIVFNGEGCLEAAMNHVLDLYEPRSITVISGCVSQIIGDEVGRVVEQFQDRAVCVHINGAGFMGDFDQGYEQALLRMSELLFENKPAAALCEKEGSFKPSDPFLRVNILGMLYDDFKKQADIHALEEILGRGVCLNCVTAGACLDEMTELDRADLTIVFQRGKQLARFLEEKYAIPWVDADYPYGITGIKALIGKIEAVLSAGHGKASKPSPVLPGRDQAWLNGVETRGAALLEKAYVFLKALYKMPVALYASGARARGMKLFLEYELGMEVKVFQDRLQKDAQEDFTARVLESGVAMVFGSSFERDGADRLGVPLFRFDYPVFDRLDLSPAPYIGEAGIVNLVEDLINLVMSAPANRGGFYNEKNMYLR